MGAGFEFWSQLKSSFQVVCQKLGIAEGTPVPIGDGFLGWILEKTEFSDDSITETLEEKPVAVWFAFGDDLGKYITQVQAFDAKREHKKF